MTPERMRKEDFVALRHPWAPWPIFIDEEKEGGTTEKPVIPGEEKKEATEEDNESGTRRLLAKLRSSGRCRGPTCRNG